MKKLFTFAAAVLASMAMMAQTTLVEFAANEADRVGTFIAGTGISFDNVKIHNNTDQVAGIKLGNSYKYSDGKYLTIKPAAGSFQAGDIISIAVCFNNSDESKVAKAAIYAADGTTLLFTTAQGVNGQKSADDPVVETYTLTVNADSLLIGRDGNTGTFITTLKVVNEGPVTQAVTSVVIDGPEAVYVDRKASFSATTDVAANAYKWFVNGAEQEGATTAKFDFTPEATGTFNISCSAKNDNNTDFVASNVIALVASVKPVLPQVTVDASTTWDWTKAASVATIQWTAETEYKKGVDTVLLANVEGMNNDDEFNSQALFFKGEYPVRNNEYSQGSMWMFNTSVAGYIQVYFSNTGGKDIPRYVAVNGVVNTAVGTLNQDIVPSAVIAVAAGEVKIEGSFEDYNEGAGVQYIHVSKIVFSTEEIPTAINNTNEAVKAVKVVRNGQLFIEKNGVVYNAQGAIVK